MEGDWGEWGIGGEIGGVMEGKWGGNGGGLGVMGDWEGNWGGNGGELGGIGGNGGGLGVLGGRLGVMGGQWEGCPPHIPPLHPRRPHGADPPLPERPAGGRHVGAHLRRHREPTVRHTAPHCDP